MVSESVSISDWSMDLATLKSMRKNVLDPLDQMSLKCRMSTKELYPFKEYAGLLMTLYNTLFTLLDEDERKLLKKIQKIQGDIISQIARGAIKEKNRTTDAMDDILRELYVAMKRHKLLFKTSEYRSTEERLRGDLGLKKKA